MTVAELVADLERRAALAEAEGATAPVGNVYRLVLEELRSLNGANRPAPPASGPERLLTAAQVAALLEVSPRYVYEHAARWPFTRKLSGKCVRFSEGGLRRWLEHRP